MSIPDLLAILNKFGFPLAVIAGLIYAFKVGLKRFDKKEEDHRDEREKWLRAFEKTQEDNKSLTKDGINAQNNVANSLDRMSDFFNKNMGKK